MDLGRKPGKVFVPENFVSAQNWTFIFLDSGIMFFRYFYRNSIDFGSFGGGLRIVVGDVWGRFGRHVWDLA